MIVYLTSALASGVFVGIKSFQYRNVAFDKLFAILPTSIVMAFTEYYVILSVVSKGYDPLLILGVGAGAGVGSLIATVTHKRLYKYIEERKKSNE